MDTLQEFTPADYAIGVVRLLKCSARLLGSEQMTLESYPRFESHSIDRILRFHAAINRQLAQAIDELERLHVRLGVRW